MCIVSYYISSILMKRMICTADHMILHVIELLVNLITP